MSNYKKTIDAAGNVTTYYNSNLTGNDDLVKRLRDANTNHIDADLWMMEAADGIEQLVATCEQLEAKLARAVEEMEKVDAYLTRLQTPNSEPLNSVNSCWAKKGRGQYTAMVRNEAREFWASLGNTIAELKGQNDE